MLEFRNEQVQWFSIAENRYDNFMVAAERLTQRAPKKKRGRQTEPDRGAVCGWFKKKPRTSGVFLGLQACPPSRAATPAGAVVLLPAWRFGRHRPCSRFRLIGAARGRIFRTRRGGVGGGVPA